MNPLIIESTEDTPKICLNPEIPEFYISGRSLPENAIEFFMPILDWMNNYAKQSLDSTIIDFNLEYFNTASAKQIAKFLKILEKIAQKKQVLIKWHYNEIDTDMLSSGKRYSKLIKLNFEFITEK